MKKRIKTYLLDLLLILTLISLLTFIRNKMKYYIQEVSKLTPTLTTLSESLQTQNLTNYNQPLVQQQLNNLNSILNKALFLNKYVLPITILLLWFITQSLIWKELNNTKPKKFILYTTPLLLSFFLTTYVFLNYLWDFFYNIKANPTLTIILSITTIILSYITFQSLSNNKLTLKPVAIPQFLLFTLTSTILLLLLTTSYIFLITETSIIIPVILILLLLIPLNFQRTYLIKKFKSN